MSNAFQRIVDDLDLHDAVSTGCSPNDLLPSRPEDKVGGELGKRFSETLRRELERGTYDPSKAYCVFVTKSYTATRPAALLTLADRVVYDAIVKRLEGRIEKYLLGSDIVMWPRGPRAPKKWKQFENLPKASPCRYVVKADVSGFYESVRHDALANAIVRATGYRPEAEALEEFLSRTMNGDTGLPQGLEPSDALATLYLSDVDFALVREGYRYARHGDDIRILCESLDHARESLFFLEANVRARGLLLNTNKTRILERGAYTKGLVSVEEKLEETKARLLDSQIEKLQEDEGKLEVALTSGDDPELHQMAWDLFYHGSITLDEVIETLRETLTPTEIVAAEQLFVDTVQSLADSDEQLDTEVFHQRLVGSLIRLTAVRSPTAVAHVGSLLKRFPDKTPVLCTYLKALARSHPGDVVAAAASVFDLAHFRNEWETAWVVRVLSRISPDVPTSLLDELLHEAGEGQRWLAAVEIAKLLGLTGRLTRELLNRMWNTCPAPFRADLIAAVAPMAKPDSWAEAFLSATQDDPIHAVVRRHAETEKKDGE